MKKEIIIIIFAAVLLNLALASAGYVSICLKNKESININSPTYSSTSPDGRLVCGSGKCTAYLKSGSGFVSICVQDLGGGLYTPPGLPSRCIGGCVSIGGNSTEPDLTLEIKFPFSDGGFSVKSSFYAGAHTNKISSISLIDNILRTEKNLCPNCRDYERSMTFPQGFNDITIRAVKGLEIREKRIKFFIDSKAPIISKTLPIANKFVGSEFTLYYNEDNIKKITLNYGTPGNYKFKELTNCQNGINQACSVDAGLEEFDGQKIEYWFVIKDIADNSAESKHTYVYVDESSPVVSSLEFSVDKNYLNLKMGIIEPNLDKVEYIDLKDSKPMWRTLCSSLQNGFCEKKISFKDGSHEVSIQASDKAGHIVSRSISFFADSKKPVISKTSPSSGFASGNFSIEFTEENPTSLVLSYGNDAVGFRNKQANLGECSDLRGKKACSVSTDLKDYDRQDISYWFDLKDIVNSTAQSKKIKLRVDATSPIISSFKYDVDSARKSINFNLGIKEDNFYKVEYMDTQDSKPMWKTLCSSLRFGACSKKVYLTAGTHDIDIKVSDKAGNYATESVPEFTI